MRYLVMLFFLIAGNSYSQTFWKWLGPYSTEIKSLTLSSSDEVYFGYSNGVWSLTGDATWHEHLLHLKPVWSLAVDAAGSIYAGTSQAGLFKTTDSGDNWLLWPLGAKSVTALTIKPNGYIFAGLWGGAYRSFNDGKSWESIGMETQKINAYISNLKGDLFAATDNSGIFRTTNDGDNWIQINNGLTFLSVHALAINSQGNIFAATQQGLFLSTNNGDNWIESDNGIKGINLLSLAVSRNGFIFAGTEEMECSNPRIMVPAGQISVGTLLTKLLKSL
jgi:ligand-binding sensor domain-containing protein